MSTPTAPTYQDHYSVLGVQPQSTPDDIRLAYNRLSAKYHPTNRETRDQEKYKAVILAYEVLSDPARRSEFDGPRETKKQEDSLEFQSDEFFESIRTENARRMALLCLLYDRRRTRPSVPGVSIREIERTMSVTTEQMFFSIWYLKQRNLVISDDKSNMQITVDGMDYLERHTPTAESILPLLNAVNKT